MRYFCFAPLREWYWWICFDLRQGNKPCAWTADEDIIVPCFVDNCCVEELRCIVEALNKCTLFIKNTGVSRRTRQGVSDRKFVRRRWREVWAIHMPVLFLQRQHKGVIQWLTPFNFFYWCFFLMTGEYITFEFRISGGFKATFSTGMVGTFVLDCHMMLPV